MFRGNQLASYDSTRLCCLKIPIAQDFSILKILLIIHFYLDELNEIKYFCTTELLYDSISLTTEILRNFVFV